MTGCPPGTGPDGSGEQNQPPVPVVLPPDLTVVSVGLPVRADGTESTDNENDDLDYEWSLTPPTGSAATLDEAFSPTPMFTPDIPGDYDLTLRLDDGFLRSGTDLPSATVTITAVDGSSATTIDDTGGEAVSSDGRLRIIVPAGALDTPTEIIITVAAPSQFPGALAVLDLPEMEVFDVQPAGLTFNAPARAEIDLEGAYAIVGGQLTATSGFMIREVDAEVEPLPGQALEPDATEPTTGVLSAEITDLGGVGVIGGVAEQGRHAAARANPPSEIPAGQAFDIEMAVYLEINDPNDFWVGSFASAIASDFSVAPVVPDPSGAAFTDVALVDSGSGVFSGVLDYLCDGAGNGIWISTVAMNFQLGAKSGELIPLQMSELITLRWPIACVAPPDLSERAVSRATWISPGASPNEILIAGTEPERWDVVTGAVTPLPETYTFGAGAAHHVYPISGDLYANDVIGKSWRWNNPTDGWQLISEVQGDHAQQFVLGADGALYGASGLGNPRKVGTDFSLSYFTTYSNVQAFWSNGTTGVMIQTGGDGNPAFNNSYPVLADVEAGTPAVPLSGNGMSEQLDQYQRLGRDLACAPAPGDATVLVCLFTGAQTSPGSLVDGQEAVDGYYAVFEVNLSGNSSSSLESNRTSAVGASAFSYMGRSGLAWADQESNAIEIREVGSTGIMWSRSIPLGSTCSKLFDFSVTPNGELGVASCWGDDGAGGADDKYVWSALLLGTNF